MKTRIALFAGVSFISKDYAFRNRTHSTSVLLVMKTLGAIAVLLLLAGCASAEPATPEATSQTEVTQPDPNDAELNPAPEETSVESEASAEPEVSEPQASEPSEPAAEPSEEASPTATARPTATAKPTSTPKPTATPEATVTAGPVFVSRAEVAKNNSRSSCLVIIDGSVYDLTKWIAQHPGGASNILNLCGSDGSSAFAGMHGGQARPSSTLQGYFFAELEN
jgi:type IV secretory pathway VirB10-like protein